MSESTFPLAHLVREPAHADGPAPLLILLHGYGSNEQDLMGLTSYLDPRFVVVSVRAPYRLMQFGFAWFELDVTPTNIGYDPAHVEMSRELIVRFIDEAVRAYNADPARVYLLGFSQGAMMGARVTLTQPELVAGAVLMSGSVVPEMAPDAEATQALAGKPFLVVHGTFDDVLPIAHGRTSREVLSQLPVSLTYKEYPMGHEVSLDSLQLVAGWLRERLDENKNAKDET
jgi:phospholipase/carboxylesterase